LNDIQPVLQDGDYWKKGDIFLVLRNLSMIMHYRPFTNEIINIITGNFYNPHDVDIISGKEISIFNNNVFHTSNERRILTNNEITIYNFETQQFSQKFAKSMKKNEVKTLGQGLSDILDDGSMLVEETDHARLLFFDSSGNLEWELVNKGANGKAFKYNWSRIIDNMELIKKIKEKVKNNECLN